MDFRISNVFDHIFREKLSGASILQWSRSFDDICVSDETKIERMDICTIVMSFPGLLLRAHVRASAEFHPKTFSKQSKFFRDFTPSENNQNHVLY